MPFAALAVPPGESVMPLTLSVEPSRPSELRVLLVEDSALIRRILCKLLDRLDGCKVVGETTTAEGAIASFRALRPDVVLLDLELESGTGFDVLREIGPELATGMTRVFVITNYVEDVFRERCMTSGAHGFYDKSRELGRLLSDLESAMAG